MASPRPFPALKESDVRRLAGAGVFKKAQRLWESDAVANPSVGAGETILLATVLDGQATYQVMVQHLAGDEFSSGCDCAEAVLCAHAIALLLAWVHAAYAFARLESVGEASTPGDRLMQEWREYLVDASLSLLRAMARRHQVPLRSGERTAILEQVVARLSTAEAQFYAIANLNEAQRRLLEMVYLLSDGRPDTQADD